VFVSIHYLFKNLNLSFRLEIISFIDIVIIQHIDVDLSRLTKLLSEAIAKFRSLKKGAQLALMNSLEKAIWNWMDNYRKSEKERKITDGLKSQTLT
jgi:hypothetical protein